MRDVQIVFFVLASYGAVAFVGCASTRQSIDGWFGGATPTPVSRAAGPSAYYAGAEGMNVYGEPSASSKVVGRLSLHERVTRFKLERGYAYVESAGGAKGWVNNAELIWRLPGAATGAPAAAAPRGEESSAEAPQEQQTAEPTATGTESLPALTNTPVPSSPESQETPAGVAPSIFDAY